MSYVSRTTTAWIVEKMREIGWRMLCEPKQELKYRETPPPLPYACDSGAWGAFVRGEEFDEARYLRMVARLSDGADWTVLPDIVGGGLESLDPSLSWLDRVPGRRLIAVQDGMTTQDIEPLVGDSVGIFVGGSTDWKLSSLRSWGKVAERTGCWLHVARVNSAKRIRLCRDAKAHSFDGTDLLRNRTHLHRLTNELGQGWLFKEAL